MRNKIVSVLMVICLMTATVFSGPATILATDKTVADFSDTGFTVSTDESEFPWLVVELNDEDVLASGNAKTLEDNFTNTKSTLVVTFTKSGLFQFEFKLSTKSKQHMLFISKDVLSGEKDNAINIPPDSTYPGYSEAKAKYSGSHDWEYSEILVEAGDSLYFTYVKNSIAPSGEDTVWLRELALEMNATCEVVANTAEGGGTVTGAGEYEYGASVTLSATPAAGHVFVGWVEDAANGKYSIVSTENPLAFDAVVDVAYTAYFVEGTSGSNFRLGAGGFDDPAEAIEAAETIENAVVVLETNYTLDTALTIPAGVTLLIPRDADGESRKEYPVPSSSQSATGLVCYKKLTIGSTGSIFVEGELEVAGSYNTRGSNVTGAVTGPYGEITNNGEITVADGAYLYAWGFISGNGTVTAESGSTVWEMFQIADWRGGSALLNMVGPKYGVGGDEEHADSSVFVFSQYYVQNIENTLILESGSTEMVLAAFNAAGFDFGVPITFIGDGGMFEIGSGGSVIKSYDITTDRLNISVEGNGAINGINIEFKDARGAEKAVDLLGSEDLLNMISIDSNEYVLPLNSNMSITVESGSTVTINQDVSVLPGTEVIVENGATVNIGEDTEIYLYPTDSWAGQDYVFGDGSDNKGYVQVPHTSAGNPEGRSLKDAELEVDGTLNIDGAIYSVFTTNDQDQRDAFAGITGTGTVNFNNYPGEEHITEQVVQGSGSSITWSDVTISPVLLVTDEGDPIETDAFAPGSSAGGSNDGWTIDQKFVLHYDANGGNGTMVDQTFTIGGAGQLNPNAFTRTGWTFLGWSGNSDSLFNPFGFMALTAMGIDPTAPENQAYYELYVAQPIADQTSMDSIPSIGQAEATVYAYWQRNAWVVTFVEMDGETVVELAEQAVDYDQCASDPGVTKQGYVLDGWFEEGSNDPFDFTTPITDDLTLYAHWSDAPSFALDATTNFDLKYDPDSDDSPVITVTVTNAALGEFTVNCASACVVAWTMDGGETYTNLIATPVAGQSNTYSFALPLAARNAGVTIAAAIRGDALLDGVVDSTDAKQIQRYSVGLRNLNALQRLAADINNDGECDSTDAKQIQRFSVGLRTFNWIEE